MLRVGKGRRARGITAATVAAGDTTAPTITSSATQTVAENSAFSLTLTADETVTWSKLTTPGADHALFSLAGNSLTMTARNFESPTDANADNVYQVTVRATDTASNTTDQTISVTVTDVADAGPNLITNGTFDSNVTGWTQALGTVSWQATGRLRATSDGVNSGRAYQAIASLSIGTVYELIVDVAAVSGTTIDIAISDTTSVGSAYTSSTGTNTTGTKTLTWTCTDATVNIILGTGGVGSGNFIEFDNVIFRTKAV